MLNEEKTLNFSNLYLSKSISLLKSMWVLPLFVFWKNFLFGDISDVDSNNMFQIWFSVKYIRYSFFTWLRLEKVFSQTYVDPKFCFFINFQKSEEYFEEFCSFRDNLLEKGFFHASSGISNWILTVKYFTLSINCRQMKQLWTSTDDLPR